MEKKSKNQTDFQKRKPSEKEQKERKIKTSLNLQHPEHY